MTRHTSLALAVASFLSLHQPSSAALTAVGDIAFTGYSAGNLSSGSNDALAFVPLVDVALGDTIFFTDDELPTIVDGEGALRWEATSAITKGTVVEIQFDGIANTGTSNLGNVIEADASFALSTGGDGLYAYLSTTDDPSNPTTFLTAINVSSTALPLAGTGLTNGVNALAPGTNTINSEYTEGTIVFADADTARLHFNNTANWTGNNTNEPDPHTFPVGTGAIVTIPEPTTPLLFSLGGIAFLLHRRRRG